MITTVAFDADYTLVDLLPAVLAGLDAVSAETGVPVGVLRADASAHWAATPHLPAREIRIAAMRESLARYGHEAQLDEMVALFFDVRYANSRPYTGVVEMLAKLRSDFRLGYATNANSRSELCGLGGQFTFEIYALQNGVPKKPAAEFFHAVLAAAQAEPAEVVYVGDTYAHDVAGAAAVGLRTVWLNRGGDPVPGEVVPDAVVASLDELPALLSRWNAAQ
ncbi:MAG: HAD family hydrolase [Hamadaea sp.]|uniref:HAD family hydrolase n=1 Tax=Hamadaea sp. TaxID=2024425 RepID=UPI00184749B0|nr:HAD family hydrolase [Hamadaea sp.]NUT23778.1 HAD family hydrolase [Hamadaea sp.]